VASALVGGIVGGFGVTPSGDRSFHWAGFAIGAAIGAGVNYLVLKLVR
jgi:hypothetical protein